MSSEAARSRAAAIVDGTFPATGQVDLGKLRRRIADELDKAETRGVQRAVIAQNAAHVDVVFVDGQQYGAPDLVFAEVEIDGRGVRAGEWIRNREGDGFTVLRITAGDIMAAQS